MHLTFECGVCHATYRLDDRQITPQGVKITCPKCLNYFFLKKGSIEDDVPVIEHLVKDGPREMATPPPPAAGDLTADQLLKDEDLGPGSVLSLEEPEVPVFSPESLGPPSAAEPGEELGNEITHTIDKDEVSDQPRKAEMDKGPSTIDFSADFSPREEPKKGLAFDQFLIPISLIIIAVVGLLYFNYHGIIRIPGLASLRQQQVEKVEPQAETSPAEPTQTKPTTTKPKDEDVKHGFPVVDKNYDSWAE